MLLLGIDLGTSSVKVSVVEGATHRCLASASYPEAESGIIALRPGWAEQSPDSWWEQVQQAIRKCHASGSYDPGAIGAIGIAYQMHGLVLVDREQQVLRNAIIWCDSRAVEIGEHAQAAIGGERCLQRLLNSPGNFTASKLAWVKAHEPEIYARTHQVLLPGDFLAMKLTGEATTTIPALSEGIFWDFASGGLSTDVLRYFDFSSSLFPSVEPLFGAHGQLKETVAAQLSLRAYIPVTYKAGDQPNNAFSLNVLHPGEVAATAGTSGVIYGVSDALTYDPRSRINSFAHVNHSLEANRIGVLLCINGAGIANRWVRSLVSPQYSYERLNLDAQRVAPGAEGLRFLPFGNGAERMLGNQTVGAHLHGLDFNLHAAGHLVRAAQEGVAFAFRYGLDIMRGNGMNPSVIRAGRANMFLSDVFAQAFVDVTGVPVELYQTDGSVGAALGAGVGAGFYTHADEAFAARKPLRRIEPLNQCDSAYDEWKALLEQRMLPIQSSVHSTIGTKPLSA